MRTKKGATGDQRQRIIYVQGQVKCTRSLVLMGDQKANTSNQIKQNNKRGKIK